MAPSGRSPSPTPANEGDAKGPKAVKDSSADASTAAGLLLPAMSRVPLRGAGGLRPALREMQGRLRLMHRHSRQVSIEGRLIISTVLVTAMSNGMCRSGDVSADLQNKNEV